jgi:hypothetical protein
LTEFNEVTVLAEEAVFVIFDNRNTMFIEELEGLWWWDACVSIFLLYYGVEINGDISILD